MELNIKDYNIYVEIIYKNNKNIYFRFNENGVLIVTCHKKVSKEEIKSLIFKL